VTDLQTLPTAYCPAGQRDLDAVVDRLLAQLCETEAAARAATPQVDRLNAWAPWSMDTGLSRAQEDFVDARSPQQALDHCRAQRQLALLLQGWAKTGVVDTGLVLTILQLAAV
jgi:hypothetical protein